jgi:hypothetical protein
VKNNNNWAIVKPNDGSCDVITKVRTINDGTRSKTISKESTRATLSQLMFNGFAIRPEIIFTIACPMRIADARDHSGIIKMRLSRF